MARSATVTSTGTVFTGAGKILGIQFRGAATAGSVTLKDGGGSGTALITVYSPASAAFAGFVPVGGIGIPFGTDIHATLTNVDGCTVIFQ